MAEWGPETAKAIENFPISGQGLPRELLLALISLKGVAATVNGAKRVIPRDVADAIHDEASRLTFEYDAGLFPVDVFQTGSGTSTNMNVNEVLATRASARLGRPVHPNDHVNASQSSNDVFPSAIHLAAVRSIVGSVVPALGRLEASLRSTAKRNAKVVKAGRTHLQDAAPVTFGQELAGWAQQVAHGRARLLDALARLGEMPLGGSAVGTGLNVPGGFARAVIAKLASDMGLPLTEAVDHAEAQSSVDAFVECSGSARVAALALYKIAGDLRLLASGPHAGLAEVSLPELQKGSSIMPGKVNPVIPEAVQQVACQVVGNDAAIAFASTLSTLQLNTAMPVIARNLLESLRLLAAAATVLAEKCIDGLAPDVDRMRRYAESSPAIVTALNPLIGYDRAAAIVKRAAAEGRSVRDVALEEPGLTRAEIDEALDPLRLATGRRRPGAARPRGTRRRGG